MQENVTKSRYHVPATDSCGMIFLDISTINIPKEIKFSVNKPN